MHFRKCFEGVHTKIKLTGKRKNLHILTRVISGYSLCLFIVKTIIFLSNLPLQKGNCCKTGILLCTTGILFCMTGILFCKLGYCSVNWNTVLHRTTIVSSGFLKSFSANGLRLLKIVKGFNTLQLD